MPLSESRIDLVRLLHENSNTNNNKHVSDTHEYIKCAVRGEKSRKSSVAQ